MKGILVSDFELIIKRNSSNMSDMKQSISRIMNDFSNVSNYNKNSDLKILLSKLNTEINQFENIKNKIEAYQILLKNVLKSYEQQAEELTKSINRLAP